MHNGRVTIYLPNRDSGYSAREYRNCENVRFFQGRIEFDGMYLGQQVHVVSGYPYLYEEAQDVKT